jgi:hypothetical protein
VATAQERGWEHAQTLCITQNLDPNLPLSEIERHGSEIQLQFGHFGIDWGAFTTPNFRDMLFGMVMQLLPHSQCDQLRDIEGSHSGSARWFCRSLVSGTLKGLRQFVPTVSVDNRPVDFKKIIGRF